MGKYIQDDKGKMAGSVGDGRNNVPTAAAGLRSLADRVEAGDTTIPLSDVLTLLRGVQLRDSGDCPRHGGTWGSDETCEHCTDASGNPRPLDAPGPLGPGADDEPSEYQTFCETCDRLVTGLTRQEAQRLERGFRFDCDTCTDPSMAGWYGLWLCRACNNTGMDCTCPAGPMYCAADGCANNRGSLEDDGCCDFCDAEATTIIDLPGGSYHACDDCADDQDDEDELCDRCGDAPRSEDSDLCAHCLDQKTIAETGSDIFGRPQTADAPGHEDDFPEVPGRRASDYLDANEGGDCICPGEQCPRDPYRCTEGCAYCGTIRVPSDEQTWKASCNQCGAFVDVRQLRADDTFTLLVCGTCDTRNDMEVCEGCLDEVPARTLTRVDGFRFCAACVAKTAENMNSSRDSWDDVAADAATLASAGWGMDEDYGMSDPGDMLDA